MKTIMYKRWIPVAVVLIGLLVAGGVWAKADAESKAQGFTKSYSTLQRSYSSDLAAVNAAGQIDISSDSKGTESVPALQQACDAASSLRANVQKNALEIPGSAGAVLSTNYRHARQKVETSEAKNIHSELSSYATVCDYYVRDSRYGNFAEEKVYQDMYAAGDYQGLTAYMTTVVIGYAKARDANQSVCPFVAPRNAICPKLRNYESLKVTYLKALRDAYATGNLAGYRAQYPAVLAAYQPAKAAYDEALAITQKTDPELQTVNQLFAKNLKQLETKLQSQSI